jgi:hypothetical protein
MIISVCRFTVNILIHNKCVCVYVYVYTYIHTLNEQHVANVFWAHYFVTVQQIKPDYAGMGKKYV